jgi:hypothetical protein
MSTEIPTSTTSIDAYDLLETSLNNLETWKAILPLTDEIVGFNGQKVNLFDFLEDETALSLNKFAIRFDASRWPPTSDGRLALVGYLQAIAEHNGTILVRDGRGILSPPAHVVGHIARRKSRSQGPLMAMAWQLIFVECHSIMIERINVPREDKSAGPPKPTRTQPVVASVNYG